jgi:hypothetical protein
MRGGKASSSGVWIFGTLVGAKSGAILDGVPGCEWKLLGRHDASGRGSKGAGESMELADMVSKSGVHGSRYGFVVLMKVTSIYER